jgi:hypothetical protein
MIDLDGAIVRGFTRAQVDGTPGFRAPELVMGQAQPNVHTDQFSGAILVLWTLLFRNVMAPLLCYDMDDPEHDEVLRWGQYAVFSEHPADRRNFEPAIGIPLFREGQLSYRMLAPRLQELTERAFIVGLREPGRRPALGEWEAALAESYDLFYACKTCRQSYTYPYWVNPAPRRRCPFCGTGAALPAPAVLELLDDRVPVRCLVLYQGLPLFANQVERGRVSPLTRRNVPVIGVTLWDSKLGVNRLGNNSDSGWRVLAGAPGFADVGRGESVPLQPGLVLSFGDGRRLARVVE